MTTVQLDPAYEDALVARLVEALGHRILAIAHADRLATCQNPKCERVFVIAHLGRRARYCSETCSDQDRQRRYRAARKAATA